MPGLHEVSDHFQSTLPMPSRLVWARLNRDNCVSDAENFYLQTCFVGKFGLSETTGEDGERRDEVRSTGEVTGF